MIKALKVFQILLIVFCSSKEISPESDEPRMLSEDVPKNSNMIPIFRRVNSNNRYSTFYVLVDLQQNSEKASQMILSLSSSETIFVTATSPWDSFVCKAPDCSLADSEELDITTSELSFKGSRLKTSTYLDYTKWFFKKGDYQPLLANSLNVNRNDWFEFGKNCSGILGMGIEKNGRNIPSLFSIFMERNESKGAILFGTNMTYAEFPTPQFIGAADDNWHLMGVKSFDIGGTIIPIKENTKVIFDLNVEGIRMHSRYKEEFIKALMNININCSANYEHMECRDKNGGYLSKYALPIFYLNFADDSLALPPTSYIKNFVIHYANQKETFKFSFFSATERREILVNPGFEDYIILGRNMLAEYYSIFDGKNHSITLYTNKLGVAQNGIVHFEDDPNVTEQLGPWLPVTAAFGLILSSYIIEIIEIRNKAKKMKKSPLGEKLIQGRFGNQKSKDSYTL